MSPPPRSVISVPPPIRKKPPPTSKTQDNTQILPSMESGQGKLFHTADLGPLQQTSCLENHPCAVLRTVPAKLPIWLISVQVVLVLAAFPLQMCLHCKYYAIILLQHCDISVHISLVSFQKVSIFKGQGCSKLTRTCSRTPSFNLES